MASGDILRLGGGSFFDYSVINIQQPALQHIVGNLNDYQTILDVTGQGFIKKCLCSPNDSSTRYRLRITIDDEVVFLRQNYGSFMSMGLLAEEYIHTSNYSQWATYRTTRATIVNESFSKNEQLPTISLTEVSPPVICILGEFIKFERNFKVEYSTGATSYPSNSCGISIIGGVK